LRQIEYHSVMRRRYKRTPRNYSGSDLTSHRLQDVLPSVLGRVTGVWRERPDLVLAAWQEVVGPSFEGMTEAVAFREGELVVRVKNSTLYSLLKQYEQPKLLKKMRERYRNVKTITFRVG